MKENVQKKVHKEDGHARSGVIVGIVAMAMHL